MREKAKRILAKLSAMNYTEAKGGERMKLFGKREKEAPLYPLEDWEPVIRSSICTGERVACMRNRSSGQLREIMLLRSSADLQAFCREYDVSEETIRTIY